MSSAGEYYGVEKQGDEYVAKYDYGQHLDGPSFKTEQEAWDFIKMEMSSREYTIPGMEDASEEFDGLISQGKKLVNKLKENSKMDTHEEAQAHFNELVAPLIKFMAQEVHPHHTLIITATSAELLEGEMCLGTEEYLVD
jgi:hypothetical protein